MTYLISEKNIIAMLNFSLDMYFLEGLEPNTHIPLNQGYWERVERDGRTWKDVIDIANTNIPDRKFSLKTYKPGELVERIEKEFGLNYLIHQPHLNQNQP